jgi:hypothetical protein
MNEIAQQILNKINMIRSLAGTWEVTKASRKKAIQDFCDQLLKLIGADADGLEFLQAESLWKEAVLNQCMAIEGCYKGDDPEGTLKCLLDWHANLGAVKADAWPSYVAWHKAKYSGFSPPVVGKMNAVQKERYEIWLSGYNA